MAALPNSGQDSNKTVSTVTPIHFAKAVGGPVAALHSEIETRLTPGEIVQFPRLERSTRMRVEEAASMAVGYLALAGFVSGLASMFIG